MSLDQTIGPPGTYVEIFWDKNENYCYDIDLEITNAPEEDVKVLYWGHQYGFMKDPAGYIGLQIVGSQRKAIFSIWDVKNGCPSEICMPIEEDGRVWRCLINYDWENNKRYRLRVRSLRIEANGDEWWIGSVFNYSTGQETTIGELLLDSSRGRLKNFYSVTWIEYAGYQGLNSNEIPYTRAIFSNHLAIQNEGEDPEIPKRLKVSYGFLPATNSNVEYLGNTTYALVAGNEVVRQTPEGKIFQRNSS